MHRVHHERGSHHYNYSDLPLWDILFGTFKNPLGDDVPCGFEKNLEQRFGKILLCRDVFNLTTIKGHFKLYMLILVGMT